MSWCHCTMCVYSIQHGEQTFESSENVRLYFIFKCKDSTLNLDSGLIESATQKARYTISLTTPFLLPKQLIVDCPTISTSPHHKATRRKLHSEDTFASSLPLEFPYTLLISSSFQCLLLLPYFEAPAVASQESSARRRLLCRPRFRHARWRRTVKRSFRPLAF